ncbi:hypothetical protein CHUAL_001273 [Chamberlinius hualienensis]
MIFVEAKNDIPIAEKSVANLQKLSKCCSPLVSVLKLFGINIQFAEGKQSFSYLMWLMRWLTFVNAIYNFAFEIYGITNGITTEDLWVLGFIDHFSVYGFLYIFCKRGDKIVQFTVQTMLICVSNHSNDETVFKRIRKMCWFLVIVSFAMVIHILFIIYPLASTFAECDRQFRVEFFGIETTPIMRAIVSGGTELSYFFTSFAIQLYSSFVILIIYLMGIGYQNINQTFSRLVNVELDDINRFQEQHQQFNEKIQNFNRLFSPAIVVLVCCQMTLIIGTTGNIKTHIDVYQKQQNQSIMTTFSMIYILLCPICRGTIGLVMLLKMTHRVHQQSREVFDQLLRVSLAHPEIYNNSIRDLISNSNRLTLFSAQLSVSPTVFTASDLFTLDYTLLGVVFSISMTYWAFVREIEDDLKSNSAMYNSTYIM